MGRIGSHYNQTVMLLMVLTTKMHDIIPILKAEWFSD